MKRAWLIALACCAASLVALHSPAQTKPPAPGLEYRRVFVPPAKLEELSQGHLPIQREEFDQLLATINAAPSGPGSAAARLTEATYSARLEQTDLVAGQARLKIQHAARENALIVLDPCSLAVRLPRWEDGTAARLGVDPAQRLAVVVEPAEDQGNEQPTAHEAELRFAWSLRGARDPGGALVFDLQLPACPAARLELDLPAGMTPQVSQGIVTPLAAADLGMDRQAWRIELGGRTKAALSIVSDETLARRQRYVVLQQATSYRVMPEALEVNVDLDLDIYHQPLRQLALDVDANLRLTSIKQGETLVAWNSAATEAGRQRIVLELAEPLSGHDRVLRIAGLAKLDREREMTLPTIRVPDAMWQEGTMSLEVAAPLELAELTPRDARQVKPPGVALREVRHFQCFSAAAALTVIVRDVAPRAQAIEGLTLKWDGPRLTARLVSELTAVDGELYELSGALPPGWIIDSVETVPPTALDDWSVADEQRGARLTLLLASALAPETPLRVVMQAHRRAPQRNERLEPSEYRLVRWRQVEARRRLVAVETETQQQLAVHGDTDLERVDPRTLTPAEADLVKATGARLVFVDQSTGPEFALALRSEAPRFSAATATAIALSPSEVREAYSLRIAPDSAPLGRVIVEFSPVADTPVTWLFGEAAAEITAQRVAQASGEVWELSFARPRSAPFTLAAERRSPLKKTDLPRVTPLVSLPAADAQQAEITLVATDGARPIIEQRNLTSCLPEAGSPAIARYRFQPAPEQRLVLGLASAKASAPLLWAWRRDLSARWDGSERLLCRARYRLQNAGATAAELRLPPESELRAVRVNGARLALASTKGALAAPLPREASFATLDVEYALPIAPASLWNAAAALVRPSEAFPVLADEVELWLAPDLRLARHETESLDWRRRLFGPLARPRGMSAPSLFAIEDWRRDLTGDRVDPAARAKAEAALAALEQLLPALPDPAVTAEDSPAESLPTPETWGAWLARYERLASDNEALLVPLMVQPQALADLGIHAETPLKAQAAGSVREALAAHGVMLVANETGLVLTAASGDEALIYAVAAQPLDSLPISAWIAQPRTPRAPWLAEERSTRSELFAAGWRRYPLVDPEERLAVYSASEARAVAWGLFLALAGIAAWLAPHRPRLAIIWLAIVAIMALWLPAPGAQLATAALLGSAAGTLLSLLLTRRRPAAPSAIDDRSAATASTRTARVATTTTAGALVLVVALAAAGQEPTPEPAKPAREVYSVLIPVDDDQQPTGDYIYLPRPFYDALSRQAKAARSVPQGWIVCEANYRGKLQAAAGGKLQFAELVAEYDLEVFQPQSNVIIGLGRENVHLLDDTVNLEGAPVRIEWLENGEGFTLPVAKAGRYRLELSLRPASRVAGPREEVELRLPRVASSQLVLQSPANSGVQVVGGIGTNASLEPGRAAVELGPTSRITVYWPSGEATATAAGETEVSQLLWWRLRSGAVTLDAQWKFKSTGRPLEEVRIIADPRLKLLPFAADQPVASHSVRAGDVQAIHVVLKEPARDVTLSASFSLAGSSGIGDLQPPRLEAVADRITRTWIGVSPVGTLDVSLEPATPIEIVAPREFATAWSAVDPPLLAFRALPGGALPALRVRPKLPLIGARQALTFVLDAGRAKAEWEAIVSVADGPVFQHSLTLPDGWRIDEAVIEEGETRRTVRVADAAPNRRTLFLPNGGVSGEHRLLIQATGRWQQRANLTLPQIALAGEGLEPPTVFIERTGHVRPQLTSHPGYELVDDGPAAPSPPRLRRVAILRPLAGATERQIDVRLDRRTPRWTARQVISIARRGEQWQAEVDITGRAQDQDEVDLLRWEVPAENGGARLSVPAEVEQIALPGQTRHQLVARLAQPRAGEFSLRLSWPLTSAAERLAVPEIRLLDAERVETLLVLPTEIAGQSLAWETRGLQAAELDPRERAALPEDALVFAASGDRYQAAVKRLERLAGVPQVRLAEINIHRLSGGHLLGVASFDLEPAGLPACRVRMPGGARLIHAMVAGAPALAQPLAGGDYELALAHERLPQRVEILFTAEVEDDAPLASPQLAQLPVERTLWTVTHGSDLELQLAEEERGVDRARQMSLRLRNAAALLEHAASQAGEGEADQLALWFAQWSRRAAGYHAALARDGAPASLTEQLQTLGAEAQALAQQWGASDKIAQALEHSARVDGLADTLALQRLGGEQTVQAMFPGMASELSLVAAPRHSLHGWERAVAVLIVAVLLVLALAFLTRPTAREFVLRYPHLPGVVFGLAWWLLLSPAVVGLAIAALFAVAALRNPWPQAA